MPKPRVLVVFGGASPEHGVSCLTASGVLAAIDPARYEVALVGIARDGRWVLADEAEVRAYRARPAGLPGVDASRPAVPGGLPEVDGSGPPALLYRDGATAVVGRLDGAAIRDRVTVDVALALLHGPFGEDGTIQGLFEMLGLRYVGAGVLASAACMDKITMNRVLQAAGLPVGAFVGLESTDWETDREGCLARCGGLGYPVFVKPARGGSSLGIRRVDEASGLAGAIEEARRFDPKVIVEQGVTDMREVECGVLIDRRNGGPVTSVPGEIQVRAAGRFYDFDLKYFADGAVDLVVPAPLEPAVVAEIQRLAAAACQALDIEGLARVDTFVTGDGVLISEVNTMPGFTPTSLFPLMWQASGVDYPALVGRLLDEALTRPLGLR